MKVYECKHFEYDYDDFDNYYLCHATPMIFNNKLECTTKCKYARKFCPYYEKGKLIGDWKISKDELTEAKKFKGRI